MNVGLFGIGATEQEDWHLFRDWLASTACGLQDVRRALILDGDQIGAIGADPVQGKAVTFCHDMLGFELIDQAYRDHNADNAYCVYLEPSQDAVYEPLAPGVGLFGNGCPQEYDYNVLGVRSGVEGAVGNLRFYSYEGTGTNPYADYAQVVRQRIAPGVANWMSVVNGFSTHKLTERGCGGEDCSADSACRAAGMIELCSPLFDWLEDPGEPFEPWRYPCVDTGVEEEPVTHLSGPVTHLYSCRPNPFHARATIRFRVAEPGRAVVQIFDVSGRLVRTLWDEVTDPGEHELVWDGQDSGKRRIEAGVYWMQLRTESGYTSGKRLLLMR